ncbi:hypothetical protein BB558_001201 [Smittium angustum]|uniref:Pre-mRNA polyadenylation factor Fip1 domain-containing protein n=1 Tax=Smittium angustum TaxID=133377 RepID=A0A2U1JC17_SMIAN|nr:hypothetical protein BB558_001201 [Smittium angustum]
MDTDQQISSNISEKDQEIIGENEDDEDNEEDDNIEFVFGDSIESSYKNPSLQSGKDGKDVPDVEGSSQQSKNDISNILTVEEGKIDMLSTPLLDGIPLYEHDLGMGTEKPWLDPGADITDYFNFGFVEQTWRLYCIKQKTLREKFNANALANERRNMLPPELAILKPESLQQMQGMMLPPFMGNMPGMPNPPSGIPGMINMGGMPMIPGMPPRMQPGMQPGMPMMMGHMGLPMIPPNMNPKDGQDAIKMFSPADKNLNAVQKREGLGNDNSETGSIENASITEVSDNKDKDDDGNELDEKTNIETVVGVNQDSPDLSSGFKGHPNSQTEPKSNKDVDSTMGKVLPPDIQLGFPIPPMDKNMAQMGFPNPNQMPRGMAPMGMNFGIPNMMGGNQMNMMGAMGPMIPGRQMMPGFNNQLEGGMMGFPGQNQQGMFPGNVQQPVNRIQNIPQNPNQPQQNQGQPQDQKPPNLQNVNRTNDPMGSNNGMDFRQQPNQGQPQKGRPGPGAPSNFRGGRNDDEYSVGSASNDGYNQSRGGDGSSQPRNRHLSPAGKSDGRRRTSNSNDSEEGGADRRRRGQGDRQEYG